MDSDLLVDLAARFIATRDENLLLTLSPELRAQTYVVVFERYCRTADFSIRVGTDYVPLSNPELVLGDVLQGVLARDAPHYRASEVERLLMAVAENHACGKKLPYESVIELAERFLSSERPPAVLAALKELHGALRREVSWQDAAGQRRAWVRIERMLRDGPPELPEPGDPWGEAALADFHALGALQKPWLRIFAYAASAPGSKPSARWLKLAGQVLAPLGQQDFVAAMARWCAEVSEAKPCAVEQYGIEPALREANAEQLKGLVWMTLLCAEEAAASCIGRLAETCFRKIPGYGARSTKVGNACLYVLGAMDGLHGVAWLARLSARVKYKEAQRLIAKALDAAALRTGQSRADLEELSLPSFGLDASGSARVQVGDRVALLLITSTTDVELVWQRPDGSMQKAVPAELVSEHAEALSDLKRQFKDLGKLLPAQGARVERLLTSSRSWSYVDFRERYLDHGLVAPIARRLLWTFAAEGVVSVGGILDGVPVDVEDRPLALGDDSRVALWHPIDASVDEVRSWRAWLARHGITQPFKQGHREIYVLTDAERTTGTYSNRFAAHVLRQHPFLALAQQRGWSYRLQGAFDSHNTPTLVLPEHRLEAQFLVDAIDNDEQASGIYLYLSTDQVCFWDAEGRTRVPLARVPPRVLSEVLRDVDLFVSVCSVGNDPSWQDGGPGGRHQEYWHQVSFGELGQLAHTRRDVLAQLLPKLKIKDRCKLTERFLVVRGDLRKYKIHLGSGNILMEPNDQYLCIVPGPSSASQTGAAKLVIPFEGDRVLSVILSKALLLAADTKIADTTITNQIRIQP